MILHPSGFIETGGCAGPRYVREQPSRETPGILLNEVTDKYVAEFNLPYRNVYRSIKDLQNNWDLLDQTQKDAVISLIKVNPASKTPEQFSKLSALKPVSALDQNMDPELQWAIPTVSILAILLLISIIYILYTKTT